MCSRVYPSVVDSLSNSAFVCYGIGWEEESPDRSAVSAHTASVALLPLSYCLFRNDLTSKKVSGFQTRPRSISSSLQMATPSACKTCLQAPLAHSAILSATMKVHQFQIEHFGK